jgi:hypothetical protein
MSLLSGRMTALFCADAIIGINKTMGKAQYCLQKLNAIRLYLIYTLCACSLLTGGCTNKKSYETEIIAIDVSLSATTNKEKYAPLVKDALNSVDADNVLVFIFGNESYEIYQGPKPGKDRDVLALYDLAYKQSDTVKWNKGTDFLKMVQFLRKKINSPTKLVIYTDGYFEQTNDSSKQIPGTVKILRQKGLKEVDIIGINIANKEKMYSWFNDNGVETLFTQ